MPARAAIAPSTGLSSADGAELAGSSNVQSTGAPLVAETQRLADGGWQVSLRLATESDGLDPESSSITVERERPGGGRDLLGEFNPEENGQLLGLCALRERGRVVLPGFTQLERVMGRVRNGQGDYALAGVVHSRLGPLDATLVAHGGGVELLAGDVVDFTYAPATRASQDAPRWYVLVRRGGETTPAQFARRPTLGERPPEHFALHPSEPNPAAGPVLFRFDLPVASPVRLEVFDLLGRKVAALADGRFPAGSHALLWDLRGVDGVPVRPGIYVCRLNAGGVPRAGEDQRASLNPSQYRQAGGDRTAAGV